jgi:hypothetical protein
LLHLHVPVGRLGFSLSSKSSSLTERIAVCSRGWSAALVTMHHPPSHNTGPATAPQLIAILLTRNPENTVSVNLPLRCRIMQ